jgi:hypothetical protein
MDAGVAWAAVGSIVAVFSLLVVVGQLRQTRIDRHDDYLRGLIPFVSIDLYDDGQGIGLIPVRVFAHGGGVAYNVGINLFSSALPMPSIGTAPSLREGAPGEIVLRGGLPARFIGRLEIGFFDVFGGRHEAWHTVNCASGPLKPTDWLHWRCLNCRVHPTDATKASWFARVRTRFRK